MADVFERAGGGHVRDVQARASENGELDVASSADGFGFRGNSLQAEANGARAFTHDAAGEERGILAVVNHRQIQRIAVVHYLAHQARGGYGFAVVADGNDPGIFHRGDFGEGFAFATYGGSADRPDVYGSGSGGAFDDGARDRGVVIYRLSIRHAAHGCESATGGGARAGLDGFGHFLAGLAQVAVQIDEAGRDD